MPRFYGSLSTIIPYLKTVHRLQRET